MILKRLIILFLIVLGLYGCHSYEKIAKIDYIKIDKNNNQKEFQGIIKAQNSAILSFQAEGKISYLPFSKGDFVKKGQTIAKLDGILYVIRKNEEQAKLHELNIKLNKQKAYYSRLDILHKEGAISDNDWESAYFELQAINQEIIIQKEKINYLNKEISYNTLSAPYDGYISQKFVTVNSFTKTGTPIVSFISTDGFEVEFFINENNINDFKINDNAKISIFNKIYDGKIIHISKSSIDSGGYLAKLSILNPDNKIKEGMNAKVSFKTNSKTNLIPLSCILTENNQNYIYKITNIKNNIGYIEKTLINLGKIENNKAEILDGIKQDDLIVLNHYDIYSTKQKVRL
ncbi:MAG: efflux RND transporter periplasmic adaptor subunit [Candidatus Gastranaerophilales bacterium]|nr:efflux RND transporter periplasmic adaptor subunit [Candidatus Gastranaerophilales bacterium]